MGPSGARHRATGIPYTTSNAQNANLTIRTPKPAHTETVGAIVGPLNLLMCLVSVRNDRPTVPWQSLRFHDTQLWRSLHDRVASATRAAAHISLLRPNDHNFGPILVRSRMADKTAPPVLILYDLECNMSSS